MATKKEVFDYIMNSPENTNPAVLKSVLGGLKEKVVVKCILNEGNVQLQDKTYEMGFYSDVYENLKKGIITELEVYSDENYYCSLVADFSYISKGSFINKWGIVFSGAMFDSNQPKILYLDWWAYGYEPTNFDTPLHIVSTS